MTSATSYTRQDKNFTYVIEGGRLGHCFGNEINEKPEDLWFAPFKQQCGWNGGDHRLKPLTVQLKSSRIVSQRQRPFLLFVQSIY